MANRNVQLRMLGIDLLELLRRIAGIREDKGCAVKARVLQARQRFPGFDSVQEYAEPDAAQDHGQRHG